MIKKLSWIRWKRYVRWWNMRIMSLCKPRVSLKRSLRSVTIVYRESYRNYVKKRISTQKSLRKLTCRYRRSSKRYLSCRRSFRCKRKKLVFTKRRRKSIRTKMTKWTYLSPCRSRSKPTFPPTTKSIIIKMRETTKEDLGLGAREIKALPGDKGKELVQLATGGGTAEGIEREL